MGAQYNKGLRVRLQQKKKQIFAKHSEKGQEKNAGFHR